MVGTLVVEVAINLVEAVVTPEVVADTREVEAVMEEVSQIA